MSNCGKAVFQRLIRNSYTLVQNYGSFPQVKAAALAWCRSQKVFEVRFRMINIIRPVLQSGYFDAYSVTPFAQL